jgi:glycosyltransferase involved in cell wall biosynthesis
MDFNFSFIIPVYNRPQEIKELLDSFVNLHFKDWFEIVLIEDGSTNTSEQIAESFKTKLKVSYYFKENSGPGDSRNYGMAKAKGNYFIILDSDCILPVNYLNIVEDSLKKDFTHCFGGPDTAHPNFTNLQKAINFSMTSFITTGGIRGGKKNNKSFEPRSFNMGISKEAFESSGGFGNIHPGEDPDLSLRLKKLGYLTKLIPEAFVYHKRRISWSKFYNQVYKFGLVRPILNNWHKEARRITYWFPWVFTIGLVIALILLVIGYRFLILVYAAYFLLVFMVSLIKNKNLIVSVMAVFAMLVQFIGYGSGFILATVYIEIFNRKPKEVFPFLFYKLK